MAEHPPPWNPPPPPGTHRPRAGETVTAAMGSFCLEFRQTHQIHEVSDPREIDGKVVRAAIYWHTDQAATGRHGLFKGGEILFEDDQDATHLAAPATPTVPSPGVSFARGTDVSHYQGAIDFAKVAAAKYSFVFIKATEGETDEDEAFERNWRGAGAAGLLRGGYHFFRVNKDPAAQVAHFVARLAAVDDGAVTLPPVLDVESQTTKPNATADEQLGHVAPGFFLESLKAAVLELRRLTGRKPIIYTGSGFWSLLPAGAAAELAPLATLWAADYNRNPHPVGGWGADWTFWQHTAKQAIPGIPTPADADVFDGDEAALQAFAAASMATAPVSSTGTADTDPHFVPVITASTSFRAVLIQIAEFDLNAGAVEHAPNAGPEIESLYLQPLGLPAGSPYCAAAASSWIRRAALASGKPAPIKGSGLAKEIMRQAQAAGLWVPVRPDIWPTLLPGDLVVWDRSVPGKPETAHQGHVGAFLDNGRDAFFTIEANADRVRDPIARILAVETCERQKNDPRLLGAVCWR